MTAFDKALESFSSIATVNKFWSSIKDEPEYVVALTDMEIRHGVLYPSCELLTLPRSSQRGTQLLCVKLRTIQKMLEWLLIQSH